MRKIFVSDFSDFCFGVKRAIRIAEDTLKNGTKPVYSLDAIIHNKEVVKRLAKKGLKVLKGNLKDIKSGTVVICSHGVYPDRLKGIRNRIAIANATCPFVKNAQKIAGELSSKGYKVVIIGDKGHPEVQSLKKFAGNKAVVISDIGEARKFRSGTGKLGVLAQTTQANKSFRAILSELFKKDFKEISVFNTICRDADMRQRATEELSKKSGTMIVVGGKDSANTRRLYDICRKAGASAYHIETAGELKKAWLKNRKSVGIVSGASTPRWIVNEVVQKLKDM
ncbi:MAG: 4-hydroxy-3-methylbut-2-enyl diphosphate reductase [Candidatus Omnitrophota bacterium]|jgi:4-hydroxy-3-methylbut-2-enyl diphosphate reductase